MKILIAIPTSKYIESATFKSIYDLKIPADCQTEFRYFPSYQIDIARNQIAVQSLEFDKLLFVDSDIVIPADALETMIRDDKDIVTAIYPKKHRDKIEYEIYVKNEKSRYIPATEIPIDDVSEVDGCGLGCCLIKTEIFKTLEYPYFLNTSLLENDRSLSEDLYFCRMVKRSGLKIFADKRIICGHLGTFDFKSQPLE